MLWFSFDFLKVYKLLSIAMDNVGLIAINNGDLAQVILYSIDGFRVDSSTISLVINYRSTDRLKQTQRQVDEVGEARLIS